MAPDLVERETRSWVDCFVIGLGLCPFAARPSRDGLVRYQVCPASAAHDIRRAALAEMLFLAEHDPGEVETTLLIVPEGLAGFFDYLNMLDEIQSALEQAGLVGVLQIASFHPDYRFEGVPADDPANYTNRSPYPMFHFIREAEMAAALENYREPESIPDRNVRLLREMPRAKLMNLVSGQDETDVDG